MPIWYDVAMPKAYSIECAQPYDSTDTSHTASAIALRDLLSRVSKSGEDASVVVLVNDKTYPDHSYDLDSYASWLQSNGFEPDVVARESQIVEACDSLLQIVDFSRLTLETAATLQSDEKYTSQLFIAAWCLVRLGYLQSERFNPELQAEELVNILPLAFKAGEDQSLDIIKATHYAEAADKIEYIFIPQA
jgi:hypothetical protein